jgi:hypothetical protein
MEHADKYYKKNTFIMVTTNAHKCIEISLYIQSELLYVSTNYMAIFRDVRYKGLDTLKL